MLKKTTIVVVCAIFLLIPIIGTAHYAIFPQKTNAILIEYSDFETSDGRVFIEPGTSRVTKDSVSLALSEAEHRIRNLFKRHDKDFKFIYCSSLSGFGKYGVDVSTVPGLSHMAPIGAYVVINGSKGVDIDVISHEMCHAQLMNSIGWYKREFEVPTWFDEGLAMTIDYRFSNLDSLLQSKKDNGMKERPLKNLASPSDFFSGSPSDVSMAYITAGSEVYNWLQSTGENGLTELIETMENGFSFEDAYLKILKENRVLQSH